MSLVASQSNPQQDSPAVVSLRGASLSTDRLWEFAPLSLSIAPGLTAIVGGEGSGKTTLLRLLSGDLTPSSGQVSAATGLWLDLRLPGLDGHTVEQVWADLANAHPTWQPDLQAELCVELDLERHLGKQLFMLSTGSRRKVGLVGLLSSGVAITCIDQPYAGLDAPSESVLRDFLQDMAEHNSRAWVVADYEADPRLPWHAVVDLDTPQP